MKLLRKLLIGGLCFLIVAACVVGTACLVKRQVYVAICDAFPILDGPVGPSVDIEVPDEPSGNAYIASQSEPDSDEPERDGRHTSRRQLELAQAAIEEGLRDASPEEREVWLDELKHESPEDIRQILSLYRRMSPPQPLPAAGRSPDEGGVQPASAEAAPPRLLQPLGIAASREAVPAAVPAIRGSDDALNLLNSSIKAIQSAEQVILNNIANANTVGFKRSRALFGDEPYRQVAVPGQLNNQGRPTTSGIALGAGSRIVATQIDISQGRLRHTEQPLDLAIQGEGYFQINDGTTIFYARAGSFAVNANGEFVLASKDRARPLEPALTIPQGTTTISITSDGIVSILQQGQTQLTQIGQIQLAQFINPQGLAARGENLFEQNTGSGTPHINTPGQNGVGEVRQGYLEESNAIVTDELAELRRMQEQMKTLQQLQREYGGNTAER